MLSLSKYAAAHSLNSTRTSGRRKHLRYRRAHHRLCRCRAGRFVDLRKGL